MSNLIKPQLSPCRAAVFSTTWSPVIQWYSLLSPPPPTPLLPHIPSFSPSLSCCASPVMASGSTLTRPSARAQTNQSRVVLFHKDQKQLVSSHVSRFFSCLPVLLHLSAWSHRNFSQVRECLPTYFIPLSMSYCLSAWLVSHLHTVKVPHTCFQAW